LLRKVIALTIAILLYLPVSASAQTDITLSELQIDLWPEFDRPSMLVIYKGTLPPGLSLPASLTLRIPVSAGEPNAVAVKQVDGSLISADYQRQVSGDWSLITFTATTPEIQMEYYDLGLEKVGNQRHYEFNWPGDYAIDQMVVRVQQPAGATNMRISPNMGSGQIADDGLVYFSTQIGSVAQGSTFTISIDYEKDSETLTSGGMQVEPSAPITSDTPGRIDLTRALPWALGGLGLLLIFGGGWWYWQSTRDEERPASQRRRRTAAAGSKQEMDISGEEIYCHQCGKRAEPGDRFCRSCGTKLRIE
jgi:hypothetical protein